MFLRFVLVYIISIISFSAYSQIKSDDENIKGKILDLSLYESDSALEIDYNKTIDKDGLMFIYRDTIPLTGKVCKYNSTKEIILESRTYVRGLLNGLFVINYPTGQMRRVAEFTNGVMHGYCLVFCYREDTLLGQIRMTGRYEEGKMVDKWYWYYDDGLMRQSGMFKKGVMVKTWEWYYENKGIEYIKQYKKGELHGKWEWYYPNGKKYIVGKCKNGKRHGKWTWYFPNGQKQYKGKFKHGRMVGKWKEWDSYDIIKREAKYYQGNEIINGKKIPAMDIEEPEEDESEEEKEQTEDVK